MELQWQSFKRFHQIMRVPRIVDVGAWQQGRKFKFRWETAEFVDCNYCQSAAMYRRRSNLAGCRINRCVTFRDILSKAGILFSNETLILILPKIKIRVQYVLDSLDTIPKNTEAELPGVQRTKSKSAKISQGHRVIVYTLREFQYLSAP